jgi:hypothetical protein
MKTSLTRLTEELQALSFGLSNSNTLILKQQQDSTMCQFLSQGLVCHTVTIHCHLLATALWQLSSCGIIGGTDFMVFRNVFSKFSLHIKTRQLYAELGLQLSDYVLELQNL